MTSTFTVSSVIMLMVADAGKIAILSQKERWAGFKRMGPLTDKNKD